MLFKRSFQNRLVTTFLLIVFLPITIIGTLLYNDTYEYISREYNKRTMERIANNTDLVNGWFGEKISILKTINSSLKYKIIDTNNKKVINEYLRDQARINGENFLNIYIHNEKGDRFDANSWVEKSKGVDITTREWYRGARNSGGIYITKPYIDLSTRRKVITLSLPILNYEGKISGVIGADFLLSSVINKIKNNINMDEETLYTITNNNGDIIYSDIDIKDSDYEKARKNKMELIKIKKEDKIYIGTYTELEDINIGVITLKDQSSYYSDLDKFTMFFISISIITAFLMMLLIIYISKKVSKPLLELKEGVKRILDGDLKTQVTNAGDDDFEELIESFNLMAKTLKDNYQNLEQQSKDLYEKNEMLQEINLELEASFNQLEATTRELNYSENKYKTLIENNPDLIWVMDTEGRITFINDAVKDILGYSSDEIIGKNISEIIYSIEDEKINKLISRFNELDFKEFDLRLLKSNTEEVVLVSANINRVFSDGKLVSIQAIGRDVTHKRNLEEAIIRNNKELTILNDISFYLTGKIKMSETLNTIVKKINELLRIEICTIRILDGDELVLKAFSGEFKEWVNKEPININEDIIGKAVQTKEMLIINNLKETSAYKESQETNNSMNDLETLIFIPLIQENIIIGSLAIGSVKEINKGDIEILKSLSNYASLAIEKSKLYESLKDSYFKTIKALATAVEAKDSYIEGHSVRVAKYSMLIAEYMNLDDDRIERINIAGILHDIGKIGIRDSILTKPGKLTKEEFIEITKHPSIGKRILKHIGLTKDVLNAVYLHHKRYDLKGYPRDVYIDSLPLEARIIGVADAFDAMTTNRSYSSAMTINNAINELKKFKGSQFCPDVVSVMEEIFEKNEERLQKILKLSSINVLEVDKKRFS